MSSRKSKGSTYGGVGGRKEKRENELFSLKINKIKGDPK